MFSTLAGSAERTADSMPDDKDDYVPMSTHSDELMHLTEQEMNRHEPVYDIDPLSDECLAAIKRLARYKPPPDDYPFEQGRAAVLIALFGNRSGTELNVLLSTRSASLRTYAGQVALPGGRMDPGDMSLEATARREAFEEVGLPANTESIRYLCSLRPFLSRALLLVTPIVVFILDYSLQPRINPAEVSSIFSLPLSAFLSHKAPSTMSPHSLPKPVRDGSEPFHNSQDYDWFGGKPHRFHTFNTAPANVFGLTAEMLIECGQIAYGRPPDYVRDAPTQMSPRDLILAAMRDPKWEEMEKLNEERIKRKMAREHAGTEVREPSRHKL